MEWTGLEWTGLDLSGLDWTGLDWTGLAVAVACFQTTPPDRFGPIWTSCLHDTPQKCTHFEPILKRNGSEMDDMWPK